MKKNHLTIVVLAVIFLLPFTLAALWYANTDKWAPSGSVNYGELISPAKPLHVLTDATDFRTGKSLAGYFDDEWTLTFLSNGRCADDCEITLYRLRQIRLATGRKMHRIKGLLVLSQQPDAAFLDLLNKDHEALAIVVVDNTEQWRAAFGNNAFTRNAGYMVDPLGNLMMRWPTKFDPAKSLKDLKRLLKVSQIG